MTDESFGTENVTKPLHQNGYLHVLFRLDDYYTLTWFSWNAILKINDYVYIYMK